MSTAVRETATGGAARPLLCDAKEALEWAAALGITRVDLKATDLGSRLKQLSLPLLADGLFGKALLANWAALKRKEAHSVELQPHPVEFAVYGRV